MRVINLNTSKETGTIYIGRADPESGRAGSALGNPFTLEEFSRAESIELYRRWLWEKIEAEDEAVLAAFMKFDEESILACWCKPEACHGDVVMEAWTWLRENRPELIKGL